MSNEMLSRKLSEDQDLATEPPIVIETNKEKKRKRSLMVFLMVVGVGAVALASITVLAPVSFYGDVISSSSTSDSGKGAAIPTALAASFKAADAKGNIIENNNGVTRSDQITISGYSDISYSTKLHCLIDLLPIYCDGSPVAVSGFPPGKHTFTIEEPSNSETIVRTFSWTGISS
jgi:hypothetical protein